MTVRETLLLHLIDTLEKTMATQIDRLTASVANLSSVLAAESQAKAALVAENTALREQLAEAKAQTVDLAPVGAPADALDQLAEEFAPAPAEQA